MAFPGSICPLLAAIGLLTTGLGRSEVDHYKRADSHRISFHAKLTTEHTCHDDGNRRCVIAKKLVEHEGVCYFQVMQGSGRTRAAAVVLETSG